MALDGFVGEAERCGEKVLEAIQMAWLDERD
jgi:FeS assembly protein IscX